MLGKSELSRIEQEETERTENTESDLSGLFLVFSVVSCSSFFWFLWKILMRPFLFLLSGMVFLCRRRRSFLDVNPRYRELLKRHGLKSPEDSECLTGEARKSSG